MPRPHQRLRCSHRDDCAAVIVVIHVVAEAVLPGQIGEPGIERDLVIRVVLKDHRRHVGFGAVPDVLNQTVDLANRTADRTVVDPDPTDLAGSVLVDEPVKVRALKPVTRQGVGVKQCNITVVERPAVIGARRGRRSNERGHRQTHHHWKKQPPIPHPRTISTMTNVNHTNVCSIRPEFSLSGPMGPHAKPNRHRFRPRPTLQ